MKGRGLELGRQPKGTIEGEFNVEVMKASFCPFAPSRQMGACSSVGSKTSDCNLLESEPESGGVCGHVPISTCNSIIKPQENLLPGMYFFRVAKFGPWTMKLVNRSSNNEFLAHVDPSVQLASHAERVTRT